MSVLSDQSDDANGLEGIAHTVADLCSMSETMDRTATEATGAMAGLKDLLRRLEALTVLSREHQRNEAKIGGLFTKVQDYIDRTTAEAQEQAGNLIAEAEVEATRIVAAAKEEAQRIVAEAQRPAGIPPEAIRRLQATIEGFAHLNSELLRELTALNHTFDEHARQEAPPPVQAPPPPPPRAWTPPPPKSQLPPPPRPKVIPGPQPVPTFRAPPAAGEGTVTALFYKSA